MEGLAEWMELLDRSHEELRGLLEELELDCLKKLLLEVDPERLEDPNVLLHALVLPTLEPVLHARDSLALLLLDADDSIDQQEQLVLVEDHKLDLGQEQLGLAILELENQSVEMKWLALLEHLPHCELNAPVAAVGIICASPWSACRVAASSTSANPSIALPLDGEGWA